VQALSGRSVHLEARRTDGSSEPLGCVTGETSVIENGGGQ
jgi:hypothetical protein